MCIIWLCRGSLSQLIKVKKTVLSQYRHDLITYEHRVESMCSYVHMSLKSSFEEILSFHGFLKVYIIWLYWL